jgi:hypothetical protein
MTATIPNNALLDTCLGEIGAPKREATITNPEVNKLATKSWPAFILIARYDIVSATCRALK